MKFPKFYNPFRRIRDLEALLEGHREAVDFERKCAASARATCAKWAKDYDHVSQANEHFMEEREEMKRKIALTSLAGRIVTAELIDCTAALHDLSATHGELKTFAEELMADNSELMDGLTYIKQVEKALGNAGVSIKCDDEGAPTVIVNEGALVAAVRDGGAVVEEPEFPALESPSEAFAA